MVIPLDIMVVMVALVIPLVVLIDLEVEAVELVPMEEQVPILPVVQEQLDCKIILELVQTHFMLLVAVVVEKRLERQVVHPSVVLVEIQAQLEQLVHQILVQVVVVVKMEALQLLRVVQELLLSDMQFNRK